MSKDAAAISIDPEFSSLCPELDANEVAYLDESLKADGCRDPIRYWNTKGHPIIDGHNRYNRCRVLGVPYYTAAMQFPDRLAVLRWIGREQLGRRNLSPIGKQMILAKLYAAEKAAALNGAPIAEPNQVPSQSEINLAKKVAEEVGVSERTVHRAARFVDAVEMLGEKSPVLRDAVMSNRQIARKDVVLAAQADKEVLRGIEQMSPQDWPAAFHATAEAIQPTRTKGSLPQVASPLSSHPTLVNLEQAVGAVVRARVKALDACGKAPWAVERAEKIRLLMVPVFDEIAAWREDAAKHM